MVIRNEVRDFGFDQSRKFEVTNFDRLGYNDPTAPYFLAVNLMETVSAVVDRAELHIINKCGHSVAEEQPETVARLITGFANG